MQVTQEHLYAAESFGELVALVFWSIYRGNSYDLTRNKPIDFSNLPTFSDSEFVYSVGDSVLSWDDYYVLKFDKNGEPRVYSRTQKGWNEHE